MREQGVIDALRTEVIVSVTIWLGRHTWDTITLCICSDKNVVDNVLL